MVNFSLLDIYIYHINVNKAWLLLDLFIFYFSERSDAGVYKCAFRDVDSDSVTGVVLFNLTSKHITQY